MKPSLFRRFFLNDTIILLLVLLNTLSVFVGGWYPQMYLFTLADAVFTALFVVEAVVKIREYGWESYWDDKWNRFDFIITVVAVPSLINLVFPGAIPTNFLLAFRVLRVFKVFRLFRFVPNISEILKGIKLALKASFVVTIGVAVLLLVLSILTSSIFGGLVPEFFGNPGLALYSTFRMFTIEGWYEIPDLIATRASEGMAVFARIYFALELFIGGILGMSLINSIFVDAAVSDNNEEVIAKLDRIEKMLAGKEEEK